MKHINKLMSLLTGVALILTLNSCDKTITSLDNPTEPLVFTGLDNTGGTWKTIEAGDITAYKVPTPLAIGDAGYKAELQEIKDAQASLTSAQQDAINYWATGSVARWNEIAREIAARYNIPPAPNPDGTYPVPSAANPSAYPKYPFANPPYAARAFAMLSVAQYDAMVAAWHYKYKHNRVAPSKADAGIKPLLPVSDLPAYPSEDAVLASASYQLLTFLFPNEDEFLKTKAAELKNARFWAGANTKSDLAIGDSLGRWVALKILARAKTDGMSTAGSTAALPAVVDAIKAKGETPWLSLDIPARPGMLANFGKVKPWNLGTDGVAGVRPTAPPLQSSNQFKAEIAELKGYAKDLSREQFRIANFWGDGAGSYTPPGHWNRVAANLILTNKLNPLRATRALAYMNTAIMDAGISCWDTKYFYMTPRPFQVDNDIKTVLGTPNFPAYTSGHSTFSAAAATVLGYFFPAEVSNLDNQAKEASESRIYGCIHYRSDCEVGLTAGKKIGQLAVDRAKKDGSN